MREHLPVRPIWLCRICGNPWPCGDARLSLTSEYAHDRVALSVYMASMMGEAANDLLRLNPQPEPDASVMFGRFLDWTKRSTSQFRMDS